MKYWKQIILTFYGKVVIIKALIVSKIVYTATVVPAPKVVIKSLNTSIYAFLWSSERESLISKLVDEQTCRWKLLFRYWIDRIGIFPEIFNDII